MKFKKKHEGYGEEGSPRLQDDASILDWEKMVVMWCNCSANDDCCWMRFVQSSVASPVNSCFTSLKKKIQS